MEHHAYANLENLIPYSRHFSANAQGTPGNYFRLLEKHGRELVCTLTGIVQTVGSGNGMRLGIDAYTLSSLSPPLCWSWCEQPISWQIFHILDSVPGSTPGSSIFFSLVFQRSLDIVFVDNSVIVDDNHPVRSAETPAPPIH